jgi:hypothetical protein
MPIPLTQIRDSSVQCAALALGRRLQLIDFNFEPEK